MADVKWIKITTDIFDDEKVLLIESLPEADSIIVIWFKLLCLAGKMNNSGVFMLNDKVAYTDKMLATIFRRKETTVKLALETFEQFGMIEIVDDVITIPNWGKHQDLDRIESRKEYMRDYMTNYRQKQKDKIEKKASSDSSKVNSKVYGKANSKVNVNEAEYISSSYSSSYSNSIINTVKERDYSEIINNKIITWLLYKKEKKQSYKPIGLQQFLNKIDKKLLELSEEDVCWVIDESMEQNYQGIIWDLLNKKKEDNRKSAPKTTPVGILDYEIENYHIHPQEPPFYGFPEEWFENYQPIRDRFVTIRQKKDPSVGITDELIFKPDELWNKYLLRKQGYETMQKGEFDI